MKDIESGLEEHYQQESTSVCSCLLIERSDGLIIGITDLDENFVFEDVFYYCGMDVSAIATTETTSVDNMEMTVIAGNDVITEKDIEVGLWNGSKLRLFEINFLDLTPGRKNTIKRGTYGEARLKRGSYVLEFRSLTQALQQPQGHATQKTCRVRFGSVGEGKCNVNGGDLAPYTHTMMITEVVSNWQFSVSSISGIENDYFKEGTIRFLTGNNSVLGEYKVKDFIDDELTLSIPFPFTVNVGDTVEVIAGCEKRFDEDCVGKFDNGPNFQGEPHMPGFDSVASSPT